MFIKKTVNSVGKTYYHLVESYREGRRVRQRTLLALGEASEGKLDQLAKAIAKHQDIISAIDLSSEIDVNQTYILGPLVVLGKLFEALGIKKVLKQVQDKHQKLEFDLQKICFTLVVSRLIRPSSKLWVYDHLLERLYPELIDRELGLHTLYRSLDLLALHKDQIESGLFWHGRELLSEQVDVVLYDLTTLRFESTREDMGLLRRFGYSKELRTDCTQWCWGCW